MKILLVQPPLHPESIVFGIMEPLALETLAAALKNHEEIGPYVEIRILDLRVEKPWKEKLVACLKEFKPSFVGLTAITIDFPMAMQVFQAIKQYSPLTKTCVGGHHATMAPEDFQEHALIDFIVKGPGIRSLPEIINQLDKGKKVFNSLSGLIYRQADGVYVENRVADDSFSMTDFPIPDRSLTQKYRRRYRFDGFPWATMTTSLGCPFKCVFCACWKIHQGKYMTRPPEEVVRELSAIPEKRVFLADDHTFGNLRRAHEIADLIKTAGIKKIYQGYCRADAIVKDPALFKKWAKIGLYALTVGVEAITEAELKDLKDGGSIDLNEQANRILADCGIHNYAHILLRSDFDQSDFERVWNYVFTQGIIHPVFPTLTPLPGTDLMAQRAAEVVIKEHQYYDLGHPVLPTELKLKEYYQELKKLMFRNYSAKRWIKARSKGMINIIAGKEVFPWRETRAPEWYTIPIAKWWIRNQLGEKKLLVFLKKHEMKGA